MYYLWPGTGRLPDANLNENVCVPALHKMTTTTPNSQPTTPRKVEKQNYDIPHQLRVQDVHAFLVAKEIPHDEREIFRRESAYPIDGTLMTQLTWRQI